LWDVYLQSHPSLICGPLHCLAVACWITDHHHPCLKLGMGISEGCFIFDFTSLPLEVARPIYPTMCTKVAVKHQSSLLSYVHGVISAEANKPLTYQLTADIKVHAYVILIIISAHMSFFCERRGCGREMWIMSFFALITVYVVHWL